MLVQVLASICTITAAEIMFTLCILSIKKSYLEVPSIFQISSFLLNIGTFI